MSNFKHLTIILGLTGLFNLSNLAIARPSYAQCIGGGKYFGDVFSAEVPL